MIDDDKIITGDKLNWRILKFCGFHEEKLEEMRPCIKFWLDVDPCQIFIETLPSPMSSTVSLAPSLSLRFTDSWGVGQPICWTLKLKIRSFMSAEDSGTDLKHDPNTKEITILIQNLLFF